MCVYVCEGCGRCMMSSVIVSRTLFTTSPPQYHLHTLSIYFTVSKMGNFYWINKWTKLEPNESRYPTSYARTKYETRTRKIILLNTRALYPPYGHRVRIGRRGEYGEKNVGAWESGGNMGFRDRVQTSGVGGHSSRDRDRKYKPTPGRNIKEHIPTSMTGFDFKYVITYV